MATCSSCKWFSYEGRNGKSTPYCGYHNSFTYAYANKSQCNAYTQRIGGGSNSSAGCYIATAVYGSYNCPEVWTLRRYRDIKLKKDGMVTFL